MKQRALLWDERQEASSLYILNNIVRKCREDNAIILIGCLVRELTKPNPLRWEVDPGLFNNALFEEE